MIDLAALGADVSEVGVLRLVFDSGAMSTVRLDDVTLVDNHESVVDTTRGGAPDGWRVRRRGLYYVIDAPGRFSFGVPTAHAEQGGWAVADACASRVPLRVVERAGSLTIYADGRMYWGGAFRSVAPTLADAAEQARQHVTPARHRRARRDGPAEPLVTAAMRTTTATTRPAAPYQVIASGPRVELTITPRTSVLSRPVLEIAGLPAGNVLVNMEGQLVGGATRLSNGDPAARAAGAHRTPDAGERPRAVMSPARAQGIRNVPIKSRFAAFP